MPWRERENVPPGLVEHNTDAEKKICSRMLRKWLFTCFVVLAHKVSVQLIQAVLPLDLLPSDCSHHEAKCLPHERQHCCSRRTAVSLVRLRGKRSLLFTTYDNVTQLRPFDGKREDEALNKLFLLHVGCAAFYMCPWAFLLSLSRSLFKKVNVNLFSHWQLKIKDPTQNSIRWDTI